MALIVTSFVECQKLRHKTIQSDWEQIFKRFRTFGHYSKVHTVFLLFLDSGIDMGPFINNVRMRGGERSCLFSKVNKRTQGEGGQKMPCLRERYL